MNYHEMRLRKGEELGIIYCILGETESSVSISQLGIPIYCCMCGSLLKEGTNLLVYS